MRLAPSPSRPARYPLAVLLAATALAGGVAMPAIAQESITEAELREQLRRRDAVIIELQRRFEELERRLEAEGLLPPVAAAAPSEAPLDPSLESDVAAPATEPAEPAGEQAVASAAPARNGRLEVDELAAERALERTLVDTGALLLQVGQAELSPSISFARRDFRFPFVDGTQVADARVERNEFTFGLGLSVGLPFDSQFEISVPYEVVNQEVSGSVGGGLPFNSTSRTGSSIGDVTVGFAKTVLRENGGWWPDVVVRGIWDTATGDKTNDGVALGGGFNQLRGQVVAVKRQDPLAFVGGLTYSYTFEDDNVQPGQQYLLSLGANLALSPETSLSATLNQAYTDDLEVNGRTINGSDQLATSFDLGGSLIVGPRTLLRLTTSIGLTDDAPDYALRASVGYRFNTPFF